MATSLRTRLWAKPTVVSAALGTVLLVIGVLALRSLEGKGLGLKGLPRMAVSVVRAVADRDSVTRLNRGLFTNIVFLHHSTGELLVEQGGMRARFASAGFDFWDQGYNRPGLRNPLGQFVGYSYFVRNDNTDPDGLARIFSQRAYSLPLNALSGLLQHEVIIMKSCFLPANNLTSDQQVTEYQRLYLQMRDTMDRHRDKLFVLLTTPPVNPAETSPEAAARAALLAGWLSSNEFVNGHPNVYVFDLFTQLADTDPASSEYGMLRPNYRTGSDSHPNQKANETVGPILVEAVIEAIDSYRTVYVQ